MQGTSRRGSRPSTESWTYRFPEESRPFNRYLAVETSSVRKALLVKKSATYESSRIQKLNKFGRTWDEWARSIGGTTNEKGKDESLESIRHTVESKILDHKIFTIVGLFGFLRAELQLRGWLERPFLWTYSKGVDQPGKPDSYHEAISKSKIMERLAKVKPDFYWNYKHMKSSDWKQVSPKQMINRLPMPNFKDSFTSKAGITACIRNAYWHDESRMSRAFSPRSYRMFEPEEVNAFVSDFGVTACAGMLKWFSHRCERDGVMTFVSDNPRFGLFGLTFALEKINAYIKTRRHDDLDETMSLVDRQWPQFLKDYQRAMSAGENVKLFQSRGSGEELLQRCHKSLDELNQYLPQTGMDGHRNMWILKPAEASQGNGIKIYNDINKILDVCMETRDGHFNWVVQKYIERPFLIEKTKFDIRQWFLVSRWDPLTVWFYKESYLRFCSKQFRFDDFHESVHLCNYAVQIKYSRADSAEVVEGYKPKTWSSTTFQQYLRESNKSHLWGTSIYPKMKEAVLSVLLSAKQIYTERNVMKKDNAFELFGADFMLTSDLVPWIIEINSLPLLSSDTKVMKDLCGNCLCDCIKVILDRRENPTAETGGFELIYQEIPGNYEENDEDAKEIMIEGTACISPESPDNGNYLTNPEMPDEHRRLPKSISKVSMHTNVTPSHLNLFGRSGRQRLKYSARPKYMYPKLALNGINRMESRLLMYKRSEDNDPSKIYLRGRVGII